jgi:hypothetical protein
VTTSDEASDATIRSAIPDDDLAIWSALEPVIRAGEVFALPREMSAGDALAYWRSPHRDVFVVESGGEVR